MSLVAETFDELLTDFREKDALTMKDIVRRMEPAFAAEGHRAETSGTPQRILVVRFDEIGDCVLTSPFLRELRRAFPRAEIDLLVKASSYPLMELCPHANHVRVAEGLPSPGQPVRDFFAWMRSFCEELWTRHYDFCFVPRWDVDETFSVLLAYFSGARERIGFSENCYPIKAREDAGMNVFLTRPIVTPIHVVHEVEKDLFLLKAGLGLQPASDKLELWLAKSDAEAVKERLRAAGILTPYIAVAVGTREGRKTYPPELLAQALLGIGAGLPFVLLGGPGEEAGGAAVAAALRKAHVPVLDLVGKTPLRQSAALVAMARLYLGGDTGLTHVAAAAKRPIVEWFCHPKDAPVSVLSLFARFSPWQARAILVQPRHAMQGCETMKTGFQEIAGCCSRSRAHCICGIAPGEIAMAARQLLGTLS